MSSLTKWLQSFNSYTIFKQMDKWTSVYLCTVATEANISRPDEQRRCNNRSA